jgi:hypothetical protein
MTSENPKLDNHFIYEEIGNNYRFFLNWRYGIVVAIVAVFYFGINLYINFIEKQIELYNYVLIGALLIILFLWICELRIRDLYHIAQKEGAKLESEYGIYKEYACDKGFLKLHESKLCKGMYKKFVSHSRIISILSFLCIGFLFYLIIKPIHYTNQTIQCELIAKVTRENIYLKQSNDSLERILNTLKISITNNSFRSKQK